MKNKLILCIGFLLFFTVIAIAQPCQGCGPRTMPTITANAAASFNSETFNVSGAHKGFSIDVLCTETGGTSDGTIIIQATNNTNWSTLTSTDFGNQISFLTNDTLTIVDAAVWKVSIDNPTFLKYRIQVLGTASDTTDVTATWVRK